jgi:hypothetical protein
MLALRRRCRPKAWPRLLAGALLTLALGTGRAAACETYYVLVFGSQRPVINQPKYTHSFATFFRVAGDPCHPETCCINAFTISWLPVTGDVRVYALLPECGRNFWLDETLQLVISEGERVSMWGPYQITPELYQSAVRRRALLDSGQVRYKAVDTLYPTDQVSNCIHALSDIAIDAPRLRIASPGWGESASYYITLSYTPWIIDSRRTYDWVAGVLGLERYYILRRDVWDRNPTRGPIQRATQDLFRLTVPRPWN